MSESVDRSDVIQSFMSITDVNSVTTATYWLEAADFSIDGAINLFFSSIASAPARAANTSSTSNSGAA
jgi:UBA-like domain